MRIRFPGPTDLLALPGQAVQARQAAAALLPQLAEVIEEVRAMLGDVRVVVRDVHATQRQAHAAATAVEVTRLQVQGIADQAAATVAAVADVAAAA